MNEIDFEKGGGLVPAIIQDANNGKVLMLGYMNQEALDLTKESGKVTFYSRSKERLWTKGETSGHYLLLDSVTVDCDGDTLLVKATPQGPTCHLGQETCFGNLESDDIFFLNELQKIIEHRKLNAPEGSYTTTLFASGINKIAQKVGEEAVEVVIEAKDSNTDKLKEETADLLFHLLVLLEHKEVKLVDVVKVLKSRHGSSGGK